MHNNFEVLEAKCRRYHLKKILKIVVPIVAIIGVVMVVLFLFPSEKKAPLKTKKIELKSKSLVVDDADIFESIAEKKQKTKIEKKNIQAKEELDIFQKSQPKRADIKYDLNPYQYEISHYKKDTNVNTHKASHKERKIVKKPKPKKLEEKKSSFSMVLKNLNTTDKMIKAYSNEKSYPIALKIAKLFYEQKRYKESSQWSKRANDIDSRAEEAWLIYAKSEYGLGHIKRAKGILKVYVNNTNSQKANSLLMSWIKGNK